MRASYQRAYFAPALFSLIPVKTDLIASMAVDTRWRLYYNEAWINAHSVEENAAVLIHEVSHLLREHDARKHAAAVTNATLWNTAADCEINDDLLAEGLPLPDNPPAPDDSVCSLVRMRRRTTASCCKPPADDAGRRRVLRASPPSATVAPARTASGGRGSCPTMMGGLAVRRRLIR